MNLNEMVKAYRMTRSHAELIKRNSYWCGDCEMTINNLSHYCGKGHCPVCGSDKVEGGENAS
jgi:Zn finger protein HypA/HybF involved in hydrogenase expression